MHTGTVIKTKYYNFYFTKVCNDSKDDCYACAGNRLAIIITKKVGVAVVRNHEKRIVRQLFRCTKTEPDIDLVVYIKRSGGDFEEKKAIFCKVMSEINSGAAET